MCKKKQFEYCPSEIDLCIRKLINTLNEIPRLTTLASCCGHKRYALTVMVYNKELKLDYEYFSGVVIPRKRKFYKKDKKGYYFIPEVEDFWKRVSK